MSKKALPMIIILILALFVTGCISTQSSNNEIRMLNVSSTGTVELEPDIARVNIGVRSQSPDAAEAFMVNQRDAEAIMETLMDLGVAQEDIQTRNFSIYAQPSQPPRDEEEENGSTQIIVVENIVAVTVRDLDSLGEILSAAVEEGANTIYGVTFDVEDKETAKEEARQQAMKDAQVQAEAIAETAGVKLGVIHSININESDSALTKSEAYAMEETAQGAGTVPISSGTLTIRVTVDISFELD